MKGRDEEYLRLLEINKKEYEKALDEWKAKKKETIEKGFTFKLRKPTIKRVRMPKPEKPKKPRGDKIKKPAPDDSLKAVIRIFCSHLQANRKLKLVDNEFEF